MAVRAGCSSGAGLLQAARSPIPPATKTSALICLIDIYWIDYKFIQAGLRARKIHIVPVPDHEHVFALGRKRNRHIALENAVPVIDHEPVFLGRPGRGTQGEIGIFIQW